MATKAALTRHSLLALVFCLAQRSYALDSKPHVLVRVEVTAPAFVRNLPQRAQAQETVSKQFAQQLTQRFPFADWPIAAQSQESKIGQLVLRVEEDSGTVPNPRIVLRWYGQLGASEVELRALSLEPIEIYEPTNPNWDTNSRHDFETRVITKLNAATRSDAFYAAFFQQFVRNLPISTAVKTPSGERVIDVPMNWREMLLAPESVVIVRFRKATGATAEIGSLRLSPVAARVQTQSSSTQPSITMLRGSVDQASFAAQPLNLVGNWNDRLPELLRDAEVRCYIADYKPLEFAGTSAGLVLGPNE